MSVSPGWKGFQGAEQRGTEGPAAGSLSSIVSPLEQCCWEGHCGVSVQEAWAACSHPLFHCSSKRLDWVTWSPGWGPGSGIESCKFDDPQLVGSPVPGWEGLGNTPLPAGFYYFIWGWIQATCLCLWLVPGMQSCSTHVLGRFSDGPSYLSISAS